MPPACLPGHQVLFLHGAIDEYVMGHVEQYKTFRLYGVENPDVDFEKMKAAEVAYCLPSHLSVNGE